MSQSNPKIRYHGLDALRAFAMLLGVALHGGMSYVGAYLEDGNLAGWPFDSSSSGLILLLIAWIHAWRMQTFFLMAGFFAHLVIQRRGMRSFLKNRFQHIFIPFVLGMIIVVPLTIAVILYGAWRTGTLAQLENDSSSGGGLPPLHLWFLYYLLGFYLVTLAVYQIADRLPELAARVLRRADQTIRWVMESRWRVLWLALPTMLLRALVTSEDVMLFGPNMMFFIYHSLFFAFGWLIFRQSALLKTLSARRVWLGDLLLGRFVVMPVRLLLSGAVSEQNLLYTGVYSLETWLVLFGLVGMFDALNSQARGWVHYLADAAYWVYLMHMPLVALLSVWLMDVHWAAFPKFMIVCGVSLGVLLATYQWGVRYTLIGQLLNGPRSRVKSAAAG